MRSHGFERFGSSVVTANFRFIPLTTDSADKNAALRTNVANAKAEQMAVLGPELHTRNLGFGFAARPHPTAPWQFIG